ncbi:MAG TPA: TIGR01777 family oxidoreductase [Candidatus Acidoferrales bacterium]
MKILISGASGFAGTALSQALRVQGHAVSHLVRPGKTPDSGDVFWDPNSATADVPAMEGFDAVVNLNGAGVADARWSDRRKQILRSSRVATTRVLVDSLAHLRRKPRVLVSASAVGYYGNRGDAALTESSGHGSDFLSILGRAWEAEAMRATPLGIRTAILRFGVILSPDGGALPRMVRPFRIGLGGRLGSGEQWMSWIALDDVLEIIRMAICGDEWSGPINVVAPNPVRNLDFTRVLAEVLHKPAIFSVPAFALRLALGEMADALLLASQRVTPAWLISAGYSFRFPEIEPALRAMLLGS